ncbi:hypothetical protein LINGRAHAP2_LOCUS7855 [Linum grandiflorum]
MFFVHILNKHFNQGPINTELVQSESPGFVTTKDVHTGHFLNGRHLFGNSPLLGQPVGANSHGDRQDREHSIGIPPIKRTNKLSIPSLYLRCCMGYITMISTSIRVAMEHIQKLPIAVSTFCKCPT